MKNLKPTKKYYFSVEGETEQWYLKWLQGIINEVSESRFKVSFDCSIQKNPVKRAKSLVITEKTVIYHFSDYESDESQHSMEFKETMDNMKKAQDIGKQITYKFGYSNFTFDLWIILHKKDCYNPLFNRGQYLTYINNAYNEQFESMKEYKHEANYKRILSKLQLSDVVCAINRSKYIMKCNNDSGYTLQEYKGFRYYKENPSLLVWEAIEKILKDCELI